jgi:uncharacterized membrane protein YgcG
MPWWRASSHRAEGEGDYYAGIHDATTTLAKLIDGEPLPAARTRAADSQPPMPWWAVLLPSRSRA